jgi:hypothetical protein
LRSYLGIRSGRSEAVVLSILSDESSRAEERTSEIREFLHKGIGQKVRPVWTKRRYRYEDRSPRTSRIEMASSRASASAKAYSTSRSLCS